MRVYSQAKRRVQTVTLVNMYRGKENVISFSVETFLKKEIVSLQEYRSAGIRTRNGMCIIPKPRELEKVVVTRADSL